MLRTFYPAAPECMSHFGTSLSDSDGGSYRSDTATVRRPRPSLRSALGPVGDSLDDLEPLGGGIGARSALAAMTNN
jgi:hypothetical protein